MARKSTALQNEETKTQLISEKDKNKIAKKILDAKHSNLLKEGLILMPTKKQIAASIKNIDPKEEFLTLGRNMLQIQKNRIALENAARQNIVNQIPDEYDQINYKPSHYSGDSLIYLYSNSLCTEENLKKIIKGMTSQIPICIWMESIIGIGPSHSSQLYSMIDIHKAPTVGHIWSYAGIDVGGKSLSKGTKCNWNPELRSRLFLISQSIIKQANNPNNIYYDIYKERKELYKARNENGEMAENARLQLEKVSKQKNPNKELVELYKSGKISDLHIEMMSRRYMIKIFLSHLHHAWYLLEFGQMPPKPFVIEHLGHVHVIEPPNMELIKELMHE